jgi:hypothetical protein
MPFMPTTHAVFSFSIFNCRRAAQQSLLLATFALLAVACGGADSGITTSSLKLVTPTTLAAISGNGQTAAVGTTFAQSLIVRATTASGTSVSGATIAFTVTSGSATLAAATATTDSTGEASTQITAGTATGPIVVTADVVGTAVATSFNVTIAAASMATACSPISLAIGATVNVSGTSACVAAGSAAAEYALIPFNAGTDPASNATVSVQATGVTAVTTPIASSIATGASTGALTSSGVLATKTSLAHQFEIGLRSRERAAMLPRLANARSFNSVVHTGTGARFNLIPSTATVGQMYSLNANASDACTKASYHAARVVAVGKKALVLADTLNPAGGFTSDDYASIAATFDTVVDAVDTKNFGQPTDIDGNGHVILFFTSAVNALTPRGSSSYVGGFFYGRDLLPTTGNSTFTACPASNFAEMFYLLVPDPNGTVNGNSFTKAFVSSNTISTTGHEYQHLINASRRMYVNTAATGFEETWLDEGLAHVAEELVFDARSGLSPKTDIDATLLRSNNAYLTTFNEDGVSNFGRLQEFLQAPSVNSPYADNDSLATRGATWSLLRYATDQQSAPQSTIWYNLVNSTTSGLANMRQVYGDLLPILRNWSTSLLMDDVSGAATADQFESWNLRSIFGAVDKGAYPLATQSLNNNGTTSVSIDGGGSAYLRFGVASGTNGAFNWTTSSSNVQFTLVRLK